MINLDTLTERITDAILEDAFLTKDNIQKRVRSILLIWSPAISAAKKNVKNTDEFVRGSERKRIELNYWKERARKRMTKEEIISAYKEIDSILVDAGYSI